MSHKTFWLEPTKRYRNELRRYSHGSDCPAKPYGMSCHDARVQLGEITADEQPVGYDPAAGEDDAEAWKKDRISRSDSRWPTRCACGYDFPAEDAWQVNFETLYEARGGARDGELHTLRDAPIGAMWDAPWFRGDGRDLKYDYLTGADGISLVVKTPGDDWLVDSEASNCTRTQFGPKEIDGKMHDKVWLGRTHYCWCRHGDPRSGSVHVDKNGDTCNAGAGSIQIGDYHGFLHNGELT